MKHLAEQSIPRVTLLVNVLTNLVTGIAVVIPILFLSFQISWWVPLLIFSTAVPLICAQIYFDNRAWSVEQAQAVTVRKMHICEQVLTGESYAKELRLFDLQHFFLHRWKSLFEQAFREMKRVRLRGTLSIICWSFVSGVGASIPYVYVIAVALNGGYTVLRNLPK